MKISHHRQAYHNCDARNLRVYRIIILQPLNGVPGYIPICTLYMEVSRRAVRRSRKDWSMTMYLPPITRQPGKPGKSGSL